MRSTTSSVDQKDIGSSPVSLEFEQSPMNQLVHLEMQSAGPAKLFFDMEGASIWTSCLRRASVEHMNRNGIVEAATGSNPVKAGVFRSEMDVKQHARQTDRRIIETAAKDAVQQFVRGAGGEPASEAVQRQYDIDRDIEFIDTSAKGEMMAQADVSAADLQAALQSIWNVEPHRGDWSDLADWQAKYVRWNPRIVCHYDDQGPFTAFWRVSPLCLRYKDIAGRVEIHAVWAARVNTRMVPTRHLRFAAAASVLNEYYKRWDSSVVVKPWVVGLASDGAAWAPLLPESEGVRWFTSHVQDRVRKYAGLLTRYSDDPYVRLPNIDDLIRCIEPSPGSHLCHGCPVVCPEMDGAAMHNSLEHETTGDTF